jgi:hypothetical protein
VFDRSIDEEGLIIEFGKFMQRKSFDYEGVEVRNQVILGIKSVRKKEI